MANLRTHFYMVGLGLLALLTQRGRVKAPHSNDRDS